jgi:uncharacterized protein (DUF2237 family)
MRLASPRRWIQPSYVPAFVPLPSVASRSARSGDPFNQQPNSQSLRSAPSSDRWCAVAHSRIKRRKTVCRSLFHWATAACLVVRLLAPKQSNKQCVASLVVGYSPSYVRTAFVPLQRSLSARSERPAQPAAKFPVPPVCPSDRWSLRAVLESRRKTVYRLLCSLGPQQLPRTVRQLKQSNNKALLLSSLDTAHLTCAAFVPLPSVAAHQPFGETRSASSQNSQCLGSAPSDRWCAVAACSARVASEDRLPLTMFTRPTAACLVVRLPN